MHLRKTTRLAAMTGIVALALAACGGSSTSTSTTSATSAAAGSGSAASGEATSAAGGAAAGGTGDGILLWTGELYANVMKEQGAKFTAETGIPVTVETIAKDLQGRFVTASQAGTGPDLVMGAHDWIGNLVQNSSIDPIPMTDATKKLFQPVSIEALTFNSQIYGVPFAVENIALYRNTTLAPEAPATWEELIATSEALKAQGKVTELLALPIEETGEPAPYHTYPLYTSAGGEVFAKNADGSYDPKQFLMGSPEGIAAMGKIGTLGSTGSGALKTSIGGNNVASIFTDQKSAFMVSGPWNLPQVQKAGFAYAISDIPKFADGVDARPFLGVQALFLASKGKNKALAQEFATNFFIQPDVAKALFDVQPRPPALISVYEEVAAADPDVEAFDAAGENGDPMPSITQMAITFDPWGKAIVAIVDGADPTSTATDMAANIQAKLGG